MVAACLVRGARGGIVAGYKFGGVLIALCYCVCAGETESVYAAAAQVPRRRHSQQRSCDRLADSRTVQARSRWARANGLALVELS